MIRACIMAFVTYYLLGTLSLPLGDFTIGADLPGMYRHCQATEDKDLTPVDFITDHLINLDGMFDKHCNGDQQKPHTPAQTQHQPVQSVLMVSPLLNFAFRTLPVLEIVQVYFSSYYKSKFVHSIFHPPILDL